MTTADKGAEQNAAPRKHKNTPTMHYYAGTPDVLITARPRNLALVTILQRMTAQRWLRINNPHANPVIQGSHSDVPSIDPDRNDRAADCVNYEECLDVAATDEITCGQQRVSEHWTCDHACPCYLAATTPCTKANSTSAYWAGARRNRDDE